jgi:hypothetical protein
MEVQSLQTVYISLETNYIRMMYFTFPHQYFEAFYIDIL